MTCTFFGHRDTPTAVRGTLYNTVTKIIEEKNVTDFYVGNHGNFDRLALSVLKELSKEYPQISYYIVYAYLPDHSEEDFSHTIYPEGIETVPKRFAIHFRNKWMIEQSDIVIAYVRNTFSNTSKFIDIANKQGKEVINIYENSKKSVENDTEIWYN